MLDLLLYIVFGYVRANYNALRQFLKRHYWRIIDYTVYPVCILCAVIVISHIRTGSYYILPVCFYLAGFYTIIFMDFIFKYPGVEEIIMISSISGFYF